MNLRIFIVAALTAVCSLGMAADIVIDGDDLSPLVAASVFDRSGSMIGTTRNDGSLPEIQPSAYPVTVRCLGYEPVTVNRPSETIAMRPTAYTLPDVVVSTADRDIMRQICYVREFSSWLTDKDTVVTYAEQMADVMLPMKKKLKKYKGRTSLRKLGSRNVTRFASAGKPDSITVNTKNANEVSFLAMIRISPDSISEPASFAGKTEAVDSIKGKSAIATIKRKTARRYFTTYDLIANHKSHRISPWIFKMLGCTIDINEFMFSNVYFTTPDGKYWPDNMELITCSIQAVGKGKIIKSAMKSNAPVELRSYIEIYPVKTEYLTTDEAKILDDGPLPKEEVRVPANALPLDAATIRLIEHGRQKAQ